MIKKQNDMSISMFSQSQFTNYCNFCAQKDQDIFIWIKSSLYAKQNNYYGKYWKTIGNIMRKYPSNKNRINYRQAMIQAYDQQIPSFEYKKFKQILNEIKPSVNANIRSQPYYNKFYLGENYSQTMMKYQIKKKLLSNSTQNRAQTGRQFKTNKSSLSTDSQDKILIDSLLKNKFNFQPVQVVEQHELTREQCSLLEIQRLRKNLSLMIEQIKMSDQMYPQVKDISRPCLDFSKTKEQLKLRKILENNFSEIHQENVGKKNSSQRLYTCPDPMQNLHIKNKNTDAYGPIFPQNPQLNKKTKKKSLVKRQLSREKSLTNFLKNKLNVNKNSRQGTQDASNIIISLTNCTKKSKSKSKLSGASKNKILMAISSSRNKIKPDKSLDKNHKLLQQYKH